MNLHLKKKNNKMFLLISQHHTHTGLQYLLREVAEKQLTEENHSRGPLDEHESEVLFKVKYLRYVKPQGCVSCQIRQYSVLQHLIENYIDLYFHFKFKFKMNKVVILLLVTYSNFMILHSVVTFDETMPSDHMLTGLHCMYMNLFKEP